MVEGECELDAIWAYIARESGSFEIATRVVEDITERFLYWPVRLSVGGATICGRACADFRRQRVSWLDKARITSFPAHQILVRFPLTDDPITRAFHQNLRRARP